MSKYAERTLEIVDPEYREIYISLGCYIEALTYAFDAYGYNTMVEYADFSDIHNDIATISYCRREDAEINNRQIETIIRRHTDKRSYNKERLNTEVITQLLKDTDCIYCYETGTMEFEYLKNGTMEAIIRQSAEAKYREELNQWMRFSNTEVEQKKDGISAEMIGLNGIIKAFYYLTTDHKNAENDTFAKQGIETAKMILRAGYVNDYGENVGVRRNLKDYITVINGD